MYLRDNLKFVDPARICAYGWGYGGYAATMVLAEDSQRILECALAINPIVSFGHHSELPIVAHLLCRSLPKLTNNSFCRFVLHREIHATGWRLPTSPTGIRPIDACRQYWFAEFLIDARHSRYHGASTAFIDVGENVDRPRSRLPSSGQCHISLTIWMKTNPLSNRFTRTKDITWVACRIICTKQLTGFWMKVSGHSRRTIGNRPVFLHLSNKWPRSRKRAKSPYFIPPKALLNAF